MSIVTPLLLQIKAKQLAAGPGVSIGPLRRHGINCRNLITPHTIRRHTHADGSLAWSKFQACVIHHRNHKALTELPLRQQASVMSSFFDKLSATQRTDLALKYNADHDSIMKQLREEEDLKREMNMWFAFRGSAARFAPSYGNYCAYYLYSGSAWGDLGSRKPFAFRKWGQRRNGTTTNGHHSNGKASHEPTPRVSFYFDRTTLTLFDVDSGSGRDETNTTHWRHRALLQFAAMTEEDQLFFQINANEVMPWRNRNSKYALFLRFLQRRSRSRDFRAKGLPGHQVYPELIREYRALSPSELSTYLDTSHSVKFPLLDHAAVKW
jgi:hypothetical protein